MSAIELRRRMSGLAWAGVITLLLGWTIFFQPSRSTLAEKQSSTRRSVEVAEGIDLFTTPPGGASFNDFENNPIPSNFFGDASDPFTGRVELEGTPLHSASWPTNLVADTIVQRKAAVTLRRAGDRTSVPVEFVALSLVGTRPISVTYNGSQNAELWDVAVCLSGAEPQTDGLLTLKADECGTDRGTFESWLPVVPRFIFTRLSDGAMRVLDYGELGLPAIEFVTQRGHWSANDAGEGLAKVQAGLTIDADCDPSTPDAGPFPASGQLFIGAFRCGADCNEGPFVARMTTLEAEYATLAWLPAGAETETECDPSELRVALAAVASTNAHDLAVTAIKPLKAVKLSVKKPSFTKTVTVSILNRGTNTESIASAAILSNLVQLTVESLGSCPNATAVMLPPKKLPILLKPNGKLSVSYNVTMDCANDPLAGVGHEDFQYLASVNLSALSETDEVASNDNCPRAPSGSDAGCGTKTSPGGPILTDVSGGSGPANQAPNGVDDSASTPNNTSVDISVLANDTDPNSDALSVTTFSQPANGSVTFTNNVATFAPNFSFSGTNTFTYTISDGHTGTDTATVTVIVGAPSIVAPPLTGGAAIDFGSATEFLYTGSNAVQTGVSNGVIDPKRVAVLRGKVKTVANQPLAGVTVTILNHPEFGQTMTRADGMFDMAVNGGSLIVVRFAKTDFLAVQRQANAPWQDYVNLPDVVMLAADPVVTPMTLGTNSLQQVARGSVQTDADGSRQATLIFPAGTTASMIVNGSTQAISAASVRATEFTVGANGPAAMPSQLPPNSGYTYCVELNADEAVAAGASSVQFDQLVSLYVENFLSFPVGQSVPIGSYNRDAGVWEATPNGRVIKILSLNAGFAILDLDGDGLEDSAPQLAALGITDAERQRLATIYAAGQTLWRSRINHFTNPWDCNWPYGPPSGAGSANRSPTGDDPPPNSCEGPANSVIKAEAQTFGEDMEIVGTPYQLHYESDRVQGYKAAYTIQIPLTEATLPPNLKRVDLIVEVAGRVSTQEFPASPSQSTGFTWDGMDVYGRVIPGKIPISVRIGYVYDAVYLAPSDFDQSFAEFSGETVAANSAREEVTLWKDWKGTVGNLPSESIGLGGWTLNVHHAYDPREKALYMGDGHRRTTAGLDTTIVNTFAGGGIIGGIPIGDGGPADAAELSIPSGTAFGPDGSFYIAESGGNRVRRVTTNGIISTFAGSSTAATCFPSTAACGDGGLATDALLNGPHGVAVAPDGTVYIADRVDHRIRKVDPNGIITTVAGTGVIGFSGDGGAATLAQLSAPNGVAIGPDGSLYIADTSNARIRKVSTMGIITSVVNGGFGFNGDGGPAVLAQLNQPWRIVVTPDGSLYIVDRGSNRIRRIGSDGIINTVAGAGGGDAFGGDGGPALSAQFSSPEDVAVAPDGSFYIADRANARVRFVGTEGIVTTVAGTGVAAFGGDGGPAMRARFAEPFGLTLGVDGTLYISDWANLRVRRMQSALPGFSSTVVLIASEDGTEVYVFDNGGRHLRTVDALTQAVRYLFAYDANGLLASVTDGDGDVTTFEHDGAGKPTGILGPFGQHTTLTANSDGYLATFNNPANEQTTFGYTVDGLLTSMTNPRNDSWSIAYDSLGRLINDTDPAGGFKELSRTETTNGFIVAISTALGRTNSYEVINLPTGGRKRIYTYPTGLQGEYEEGTDASFISRFPDGSVSTTVMGPDPRWSMLSPVAITNVTTTPGGLSNVVSTGRSVTLTNATDPFSVNIWTETNKINGRQYLSTYAAASKILTNTTPSGRKSIVTYDSLMRPVREEIVGLQPIITAYDSHGRISSIVQGSGAQARTNTFAYNASGYLTNTTDSLDRKLTLAYDEAGRVISQTFPDNRVLGFAYDAAGNSTGFTSPGRPAHTFAYTPVNLPSLYTPPTVGAGANTTQFAHDLDRALTLVTRPDGLTLQYDYTGSGCNCDRLNAIIQPGGTNTYTYDVVTGNLTSISSPGGIVMTYTYDGPLLLSETWSGPVTGSVSFAHDNDFRTTSQTVDGNSVALQYDADSLLIQIGTLVLTNDAQTGLLLGGTLGTVADTWSYNGFAEPSTHNATSNSASLYNAQYTRDALGRIVGVTEIISGATNVFTYAYDLFGQLTNVTQNAAAVASYTYDSNNNRLTTTDTGGTRSGTYDNQDRLTQYDSATFAYTANGELKSKTNGVQVTSYQYDPLGNLTAVTLPAGTQIQYLIDGLDRRIGKKNNGTLVQGFLYDGQLDIVAELDGTGAVVSRFVYGSRDNVPEYMIKGGTTYRFITDHLGSVRLVVNTTTGQIAQRMDYDAFGQVLADTSPGFQPFGFAGGLYDRDTQLVRFGARDYDAESGRWTAHDPILFNGNQANLYAYVNNDPVNAKDADGLGKGKGGFKEIKIPQQKKKQSKKSKEAAAPKEEEQKKDETPQEKKDPCPTPSSSGGPPAQQKQQLKDYKPKSDKKDWSDPYSG